MENKKLIISIEDENDISELIGYTLQKEKFDFLAFEDGESFFNHKFNTEPSLLVLDVMLPGMDGIEILKRVRSSQETKNLPVIMLTAKNSEIDKILGLEFGADDYLTKPFSPRELVARIKAILRRSTPIKEQENTIVFGGITLLLDQYRLMIDNEVISLTTTEFKFFQLLISNIGKVYSREQIIDKTLGENVYITDRTVDVHITQIRKKIGEYAKHLKSVRGIGYKFEEEK